VSDQETITPVLPPGPLSGNATVSTAVLRQTLAFTEEWTEILADYINRNFREGIDFGAVKGGSKNGREFTGKPTLLKPGAEKLTLAMGLRARFVQDRQTYAMAGSPAGLIALKCLLVDSAGEVAGEGRGAATLAEKNSINNAVKFAEKRAQVDAVLRLGGLSGYFEQEEDQERQQTAQTGNNRPANQAPNRPRALPAPNLDAMSDEELYRYAEGQYRKWQAKHPEAPPLSADIQAPANRPQDSASAPVESRAGAPAQGRSPAPTSGAASLTRAAEASTHENSDPAGHLATPEQIARIRALAAPAGKTVDGLCADLRVVTLGNLSNERADRLIARLQELAADRAQVVGA
jgi:hypothetical protein